MSPETIVRKSESMARIESLIAAPRPDDAGWRAELTAAVDALDALLRPFASYDRERFGGPVSRDRLVTGVRARFGLPGPWVGSGGCPPSRAPSA